MLAAGGDDTATLLAGAATTHRRYRYQVGTASRRRYVEGNSDLVLALDFDPTGALAASGGIDGTVHMGCPKWL